MSLFNTPVVLPILLITKIKQNLNVNLLCCVVLCCVVVVQLNVEASS